MARPPTPPAWRWGIGLGVVALAALTYLAREWLGPRVQAACGLICFLGLTAALSSNLRAVNWRTIGWGLALQIFLALFVIQFRIYGLEGIGIPDGYRPGFEFFRAVTEVFKKFLEFTHAGSRFIFGRLADPAAMDEVFGENKGYVFAFSALPTVIFVASFFSVLYYFGVLQFLVRVMARLMVRLLGTSGAETLSVSANVFLGQTEAPLIVKPYVAGMTRSELLTLMVGGMAHISGALMAVYIDMGANAVAILATSVMAAPGSLYLSKLFLPEVDEPATRGTVKTAVEEKHANVIDAASAGAAEGLRLALNIAAMLIAFLAFIAMFNYLLGQVYPGLTLNKVFSWLFAPVAVLLGVEDADVPRMAQLLGTKLVANEFVAFTELKDMLAQLSPRTKVLATYALTGFANFASIGIQLGGIGAMAPSRRADLARLGGRALLVGFLVTLINASIAGMLSDLSGPSD
jgi:CNT family concentrative nucleoside transporter